MTDEIREDDEIQQDDGQATGPRAGADKTVVALLGAVVVLLLVVVGIVAWPALAGDDTPPPTQDAAQSAPSQGDVPADMPAGTAVAEVDPAEATQVPADTTPEDFASAYYESLLAGDFGDAYNRLPTSDKVQTYPTVEDFQATIQGYGVTGYELVSFQDTDDGFYTVIVDQGTDYGTFTNQWVFQAVDGGWVVNDKAVTGMK